ncbi:MAG: type I restriction enzyme HsdR N-terminal domain-containing protein [Saprospiraceae bacterium]|nr:type I restriction enzyme HsdR N-terminal domain-containing protein [Saprospiraceae bacterium]
MSSDQPEITLQLLALKEHLKIREQGSQHNIWDPVRKQYIALTPEELVRQLFIQYLLNEGKAKLTRLSVERQILVFGQRRRYDLMIHDKQGGALALIEVKAPDVPLTQKTLDQITRYNMAIDVSWLIVSNGIQTYCYQLDRAAGLARIQPSIPDFNDE